MIEDGVYIDMTLGGALEKKVRTVGKEKFF